MKIKKLTTGLVLFSCVLGSASAYENSCRDSASVSSHGERAIHKCLSIKKLMIENKDIYLGMNKRDWKKWLQTTEKSFRSVAEGTAEFHNYRDIVEEACKFVPVDVMLRGGLSFKPPAGSGRALQDYELKSKFDRGDAPDGN